VLPFFKGNEPLPYPAPPVFLLDDENKKVTKEQDEMVYGLGHTARHGKRFAEIAIITSQAFCTEVNLDIAVYDDFGNIVAEGFDAGIRFGGSIAEEMIAVPIGGVLLDHGRLFRRFGERPGWDR
jgi:hypothetical protein